MRRIIVSEMVALGGFFARPKGEIDWFLWNDEMAKSAITLLWKLIFHKLALMRR